MEKAMKKAELPKTDSIEQLAAFWDTHDLTDFAGELEEVPGPVFVRGAAVKVRLPARAAKAVEKIAKEQGVTEEELIRTWVREKIARKPNACRSRRRT